MGLRINTDKTQYIYMGEETTNLLLKNNETVRKRNDYKHVGLDRRRTNNLFSGLIVHAL